VDQIVAYIDSQPEPKRSDLRTLHHHILEIMPNARLWFLDGKNDDNKTVSNPNIGYGFQVMTLVGGKTREFYQIGVSANTSGISVYILGLEDKKYLAQMLTFAGVNRAMLLGNVSSRSVHVSWSSVAPDAQSVWAAST